MASLEEALAQSIDNEPIAPVNDVLVIDPEKRLINVPDSESLFGVFGENIVERKYFTCPRIVLNNIDLFECYIFINYISASGRIGYIQADDVVLDETENYIVFSWELTSNVFDKNMDSIIYFSVSAKQYVDDREPVFFTRKAQGKMYETVNGTEIIQEQYADIILQLLAKMNNVEQIATPEAMQAYVDNWLKENPSAIGGQPVPVESASGMLNTQTLYLYMGKGETVDGVVYERGYVYYYVEDTQSWTKGSLYGGEGGGSSFSGNASDVSYDDTETKLGADNVQDAVGRLSETIVDYRDEVSEYKEEVNNLPNNETLISKVVENVPLVKTAEIPIFVTSESEMTDYSKIYVYNGFIYQYGKRIEKVENSTFSKGKVSLIENKRYSHSSTVFKDAEGYHLLIIPVESKDKSDEFVLNFTNMAYQTNWSGLYYGTTNNAFTSTGTIVMGSDNKSCIVSGIPAGKYYIAYCVVADDRSNVGITVDGVEFDIVIDTTDSIQAHFPIENNTTEEVETWGFINTNCAFAPADYEAQIIKLEIEVDDLKGRIGTVDSSSVVYNAIGKTYPPYQIPAGSSFEGYDIDLLGTTANDIYSYIDNVVSEKETVTKEILGKDASNTYDVVRYIYANREYIAWQKVNYPKMYAWKNGNTIIYSTSVSPRIGDVMYSTMYIGTSYGTVTTVSATNRSRTVNNLEFVRYEIGDIEPAIFYTDIDDERNNNATITKDGVTYNRYPLGDLGSNRRKLIPIFIYANEHGVLPDTSGEAYETKMCALIASRFLKDCATGKQENNPLYKYIRDNCMLIVIPVANPFGYNINITGGTTTNTTTGYLNANKCNINRNYDTPGWDYMIENGTGENMGSYVGSENETQYIMNTMVESGAVVAMSLHGLGSWEGHCAHQGQQPDGTDYNQEKLAKIVNFLSNNYGYTLSYYDGKPCTNTPDITSKSPSYITQCGAYGGIIEMSPDDVKTSGWKQEMKSNVIENAYAQVLNLTAMWLSDYLEN